MYDINSVDELIDELGGPLELARELDISQPAVSQWKSRGIGTGWHMLLYAKAIRRGKTVCPAVFGLTEEEFAPIGEARAKPTPRVAHG